MLFRKIISQIYLYYLEGTVSVISSNPPDKAFYGTVVNRALPYLN